MTDPAALALDRAEAERVVPTIEWLLAAARAALHGPLGHDYASTLGVLAAAHRPLQSAMNVVEHFDAVATSPQWRAARDTVQPQVDAYFREVALDSRLGDRLSRLNPAALDAVQRRHVGLVLRTRTAAGADLPVAGQRQVAALTQNLARAVSEPGHAASVIALRHARARLVGYRHFFAQQLHGRMLDDADAVLRFLDEAQAIAHALPPAPTTDPQAVAEYLSLPQLLPALLQLVQERFGVTTVAAPDLPRWHESVRSYRMFCGARALGTCYLDLHARPGKRESNGTWTHGLHTGPPHVAVLCANVGEQQLTHREVRMLFHEMGHVLHHMCSVVEVAELGGVAVVRDFVELPSHLLESWAFERASLDRFARHHETGEPLPEALRDTVVATREDPRESLRQLAIARADAVLHTTAPDDPLAVAQSIVGAATRDDASRICAPLFAHAEGYAGGYYAYPWGRMLANVVAARVTDRAGGLALRQEILEHGNASDPNALMYAFMARTSGLPPALARPRQGSLLLNE